MKPKSFYVISALRCDSSQLGHLKRFDTEAQAIDHAHNVIQIRAQDGKHTISFHVLKVVAMVEPRAVPIKTTRFR